MSRYLDTLNAPQKEVVLHNKGPMLVLASAGSGKTACITRRIARLIDEEHVHPSRILGVTFTNKAAGEMRERVEGLLRHKAKGLWLCTFHAAASRILRRVAEQFPFGRTATFEIMDQATQMKEMKAVIQHDLKLDDKDYKPATFLQVIQSVKNLGELPHEYDYEGYTNARYYQQAARFYEARLRAVNSFDFGDLLLYATQALGLKRSLAEEYSDQFEYIMVDEMQDTNPVQLLFLDYLTSMHKNLCVVGDDFQVIFSWRAANVQTILNFPIDYPGTKEIWLEQNYRSTPQLVEAANNLIAVNKVQSKKVCFTENPPGASGPLIYQHRTEREESWWVVDQVLRHKQQGVLWGQQAVVYRTNAQSRVLEEAFVAKGIPYNVKGSFKFYDREEIQDLLAYLKVLINPANRMAWERIANKPSRGLGASSVKALVEYAQEHKVTFRVALTEAHYLFKGATRGKIDAFVALMESFELLLPSLSPSALLKTVIDGLQFEGWLKGKGDVTADGEDRWQNVLELLRAVEIYEQDTDPAEISLLGFLERAALVSQEDDAAEQDKNRVLLSTIHAVKGLEFDVVYVTGVEQGLIPHFNSMHAPEELEEDRRVFYVAITRAKRWLYLSHVRTRYIYGKPIDSRPSQFIRELALDNSR